jgi:hypothetical protein
MEEIKFPEPPNGKDFEHFNDFKDAIKKWTSEYQKVYEAAHPVELDQEPPKAGDEPKAPPQTEEPRRKPDETSDVYQARLTEWAQGVEKWYKEVYLPFEIERSKWYVAFNVRRDWEALVRVHLNRKHEFREKMMFGLVKAAIAGAVGAAMLLAALRAF